MPVILFLIFAACKGDVAPAEDPFEGVERDEVRVLEGLRCPVEVLRTEGDVPHIYARDRVDLMRVQGFVVARHRYFMLDLARRLALGRASELLGADALEVDMESRGLAMTFVADQLLATVSEEQLTYFDAFAAGVRR